MRGTSKTENLKVWDDFTLFDKRNCTPWMRANFEMAYMMAMDKYLGRMAIITKANFSKTRRKDLESIDLRTVIFIWEVIMTLYLRVMGSLFLKMEYLCKVCGRTISCKGLLSKELIETKNTSNSTKITNL